MKRYLFKFIVALGLTCIGYGVYGQAASAKLFYAIERLSDGEIVRRGTMQEEGIPMGDVILAPNTKFRIWKYEANSKLVAMEEFITPEAGQQFRIPSPLFRLPETRDADGDGLSAEAELIVGSDPAKADTDGDGINDGQAIALGMNPAAASIIGIIGTVDSPGTAVDLCAINDIVVLADSEGGVSIYNVFNGMEPIILEDIKTYGPATAVACSSLNLVAVGLGEQGLSVVDFSDPQNVKQLYTRKLDDAVLSVATALDLGFVGMAGGDVVMMDLTSGSIIHRLTIGRRVEDLAVEKNRLFAFAGGRLHVIGFGDAELKILGSTEAEGNINDSHGRARIFVGGDRAYLVFRDGYSLFDVSESTPILMLKGLTPQFGWKQMVLNGNGLGIVAVSPNLALDGPHNVSLYDFSNEDQVGVFESEFPTPSVARAVTIYNGLAYVADHAAGLHVLGYIGIDLGGIPPEGNLTSTNVDGRLQEGERTFITAHVTDDVQVRNVEFYLGNEKIATDGNFPFELAWRAPGGSAGSLASIRAIASDTGGNRSELEPISFLITPDVTPPSVEVVNQIEEIILIEGDELEIKLNANDNVGIAEFQLRLNGRIADYRRVGVDSYQLVGPPLLGNHILEIMVLDYAGLSAATGPLNVRVFEQVISRSFSIYNYGVEKFETETISREISIFRFDEVEQNKEVITREIGVFNELGSNGSN